MARAPLSPVGSFPVRAEDRSVVAIMPIYNGERWVESALQSIVEQTVLPNQVLIVDDGSSDGSRAIAERFAAENAYIQILTQENAGQSAARNLAIAASTCRWVALIDQDDLWYPNHIEDLLKGARRHRGLRLGWVYSDFDDIDADGRLIMRDFIERQRHQNPKRDLRLVLGDGFVIQPSATLIRRDAIIAVGGFDEKLSGYEDDDLFLRLFLGNYDNVWVPTPTSQWRIHESSAGGSDRMDESLRYYGQKLKGMFPNDRWRGVYYLRDAIAPRMLRTWMQMYLRSSRYRDYRKMKIYAREARGWARFLPPRHRVAMWWILGAMGLPFVIRLRLATADNDSAALAPFVALARRAARM